LFSRKRLLPLGKAISLPNTRAAMIGQFTF